VFNYGLLLSQSSQAQVVFAVPSVSFRDALLRAGTQGKALPTALQLFGRTGAPPKSVQSR